MNEFEFNLLKSLPIDDEILNIDFDQIKVIYDTLQEKFQFSSVDLLYITFCCPQILTCNKKEFVKNLTALASLNNLRAKEIKYFVIKYPFVLLLNGSRLLYKIDLVSKLMALSKKEAIKVLYTFPDLMFISKVQVKNQICMLSENLDEFGLGLRKVFAQNSQAMYLTKEQLSDLKDILMKKFTLSSTEANNVLKADPSLLSLSQDDLNKKYNFYYPRYFVKRDLKEIIPKHPEFLSLKEEEFICKLLDVEKSLSLTENQALQFIRLNPEVLFISDFSQKISGLKKFNINTEFIKRTPQLCSVLEMTLPIKFVLARILNLENYFADICKMNTRLFLSRFLFMQISEKFDHADLLISDDEFFEKYNISHRMLMLNYKINKDVINNICKYYASQKDSMLGWTDVVFPSEMQVQDFLLDRECTTEQYFPPYFELREKHNISKSEYNFYKALTRFHLSIPEIKLVLKKCPSLAKCGVNNILSIFELMRKNGVSFEGMLITLLQKPSLFTHAICDFDQLVCEIVDYYDCNFKDALEKYMF